MYFPIDRYFHRYSRETFIEKHRPRWEKKETKRKDRRSERGEKLGGGLGAIDQVAAGFRGSIGMYDRRANWSFRSFAFNFFREEEGKGRKIVCARAMLAAVFHRDDNFIGNGPRVFRLDSWRVRYNNRILRFRTDILSLRVPFLPRSSSPFFFLPGVPFLDRARLWCTPLRT